MLETNRVILKKLGNDDYDDVKQLYMNEDTRKYLGGVVDCERFNKRFYEMNESKCGSLYWVINKIGSNEFIGVISIENHHDGLDKEVSYELLPKWWGQGYGTEIVSKVIEYAFNVLGLQRIIAETQSANINSCKLLKKAGMILKEKKERFGAEQSIFIIENKVCM